MAQVLAHLRHSGAQILRDLGVRTMRGAERAEAPMHGLSAFGLEVAEYVD